MSTHGTLTPIHRDAIIAMAAANDPIIPSHALTYAQMVLRGLAVMLSNDALDRWIAYYVWGES